MQLLDTKKGGYITAASFINSNLIFNLMFIQVFPDGISDKYNVVNFS